MFTLSGNANIQQEKKQPSIAARIWSLYVDGFRSMTVGKTLWLIIFIKLFLFFVVIKLLFFPDFLSQKGSNEAEKAAYVRSELTR